MSYWRLAYALHNNIHVLVETNPPFPELVVIFFWTMNFYPPLVLSRFCFLDGQYRQKCDWNDIYCYDNTVHECVSLSFELKHYCDTTPLSKQSKS